jgi:cytochrome c553
MNRALKWAGYGLAGVIALAAVVVTGAFAATEAMIRWPVAKASGVAVASRDPGAVERGRALAVEYACHGCHADGLQGQMFHEIPGLFRGWAPNLTLAAARQTDAQLDAALRHGVAADGRRLWIMPSNAFAHLSDQEAGDLIAYMRSYEPTGQDLPRTEFGPLARLGILLGKFLSEPARIAKDRGLAPLDLGPRFTRGRSLSRACIECHGPTLSGNEMIGAPDLMVAASYQPDEFRRLIREGVAPGGRKLGFMRSVGPERLRGWSDDDVAALDAYLRARATHLARHAEAGAAQP